MLAYMYTFAPGTVNAGDKPDGNKGHFSVRFPEGKQPYFSSDYSHVSSLKKEKEDNVEK